jgi:hypothetical protein
MTDASGSARDLLRHTLATLAYRAAKVLRDVPEGFGELKLSSGRTPVEVVAHLGDLMEWGERMARGEYLWAPKPTARWDAACDRFFNGLAAFDAAVERSSFQEYSAGTIFQGPIADALTHVGQLAMMRGLAGAPVRPESYARAEITIGRVGRDQAPARKEFDGDASRPRQKKDPVDEASEESFPASDPPATTGTATTRARKV